MLVQHLTLANSVGYLLEWYTDVVVMLRVLSGDVKPTSEASQIRLLLA